jgi:tRNA-specific 2-thiouridylase
LGIGGRAGSAAAPWYVADKDAARNALIVVQDQDHPLLLSDAFDVEQMHWMIARETPTHETAAQPFECTVKTRYRQADLNCRAYRTADGDWHVILQEPARAVTPGQYAVFYDGARCLGGGVICRRFNSRAAPEARQIPYNSHFSVEGA